MRLKNVKNRINAALISGIILSLFAFTACGSDESSGDGDEVVYTPVTESDTYNGTDEVFKVETTGNTEITYSIDLGGYARTVYYIFTNTNLTADTTSPTYIANIINQGNEGFSLARPDISNSKSSSVWGKTLQRGKINIAQYNSNPWKNSGIEKSSERGRIFSIADNTTGPLKSTVDDTNSFMNTSVSDTIPATCKKVVTVGSKTLNIWVADDCWESGSTKAHYITDSMLNEMANKFLLSGADNDVYDWLTNIYGAEWGAHTYSDLIIPDDNIHILLYDIDGDNSTTGGVLGFFWAKDNFIKSASVPNSNEKIMFYMDAVMYATPDEAWGIGDPMPAEIISTLAHEFQHMIHFYQKNILDDVADTDVWVNEMCSLVTEDLLADKLLVNGPRGVDYGTPGAGSSNNSDGRLPLFNYWDDAPLPVWLEGNDAIISYSVSYAFGAYLARNYGGAALFRDIVTGVTGSSVYGDYRDVVEAIKANGGASDITMSDMMRDWGAAVVLSGKTSISSAGKFKYNNGNTYMTSTIDNTITYNLGSINLFNYVFQYDTSSYLYEPWCYSVTGLNSYSLGTMNRGSNIYVKEPYDSGIKTRKFRIRDGVKLTVVVK